MKRFSSIPLVRRPTLDDVAERAGVSRTLVSLTLRGLAGASEETTRVILQAASDLGYVPDAAARNLARNASQSIGVLLNDMHNPFFADVVGGLQTRMLEAGYHILMAVGEGLRLERSVLDTFRSYRMEGAVLIGPEVREREIEAFGRGVATVVIGRQVRTDAVDVIVGDDRKGAMLAVQHLYDLGHRDIAHLDGANIPGGGNARRRGYLDGMRRLGLDRYVRIAGGGFTLRHAADGIDVLVRERPPTAVFAANDLVALGAMERLSELGLSTPGDVSIVGYDNTSIAAQRRVGLTSIDQPRVEIGELAASLLQERFAGRTEASRHVLTPKLVERDSTATRASSSKRRGHATTTSTTATLRKTKP
jgi:DNA-binding LacI/PurR family transcriptional regulator